MRIFSLLALGVWLVGVLGGDARAESLRSLGSLERESVEEALSERGLAVDPNPAGKVIGQVVVVNQEVFSRHDWRFRALNVLHRTTRAEILERELLFSSGQVWDEALAEESVRNLQAPAPLFFSDGTRYAAPQLSSVVAIVPVVSATPGVVDALVVTRDLWSLRFNTDFKFQKNTLSMLITSLSENNLLGWRKNLAAGFQLDQGRMGIGPTYSDPNIAGTRLMLLASGMAWRSRDEGRFEGDEEQFSLRYPLYALSQRWGAGLDVSHQDVVKRQFCETRLCPAAVAGTLVPLAYRTRRLTVDAGVVRSFGRQVIQRLSAGYRLEKRGAEVLRGFPSDPSLAGAFLATYAPQPEIRSEPYLRYELFTPRYGVYRDLDTFDLRENRRLGPLVAIEIAAGLPGLGADFMAYPIGATLGWTVAPWGTGFGVAQLQATARARSGGLIDERLSGILQFASPPLADLGRVVVSATTDAVRRDTYRTQYFLGGDTGLRGYEIGDFSGVAQASAHVELRSAPIPVHSQRFGAVLFYDVGHAAESYQALRPHHDVGIGLRWLIPQLNSSVLRVDWAVATQAGNYTRAGLPGRITAGFMQSFWLLDSPKGYLPIF